MMKLMLLTPMLLTPMLSTMIAFELPERVQTLPRPTRSDLPNRLALATGRRADLYFSGMQKPIRMRLSEADFRELEQTCRSLALSSEIRLYSHPVQPNACASCLLP
jgi:hypothetical protein